MSGCYGNYAEDRYYSNLCDQYTDQIFDDCEECEEDEDFDELMNEDAPE